MLLLEGTLESLLLAMGDVDGSEAWELVLVSTPLATEALPPVELETAALLITLLPEELLLLEAMDMGVEAGRLPELLELPSARALDLASLASLLLLGSLFSLLLAVIKPGDDADRNQALLLLRLLLPLLLPLLPLVSPSPFPDELSLLLGPLLLLPAFI